MDPISVLDLFLVGGAVIGVGTMYLFVATAIEYRHRDNGLAYILFVLGVGVWNGMFAPAVLVGDPVSEQFFLSLSVVGALLAGLGWFLFAATASSTPDLPGRRLLYRAIAVLVGLGIAVAMTTPIHGLYLQTDTAGGASVTGIEYGLGYWLYTALLVGLYTAGTLLFAADWRGNDAVPYPRWYTAVGLLAVVAIVGSNMLAPAGISVAPMVVILLTTIGWLQAKRWSGFEQLSGGLTPTW